MDDEWRELTVEELEAEEMLVLPDREARSILRTDLGVSLAEAVQILSDEPADAGDTSADDGGGNG